MNSQLYKVIYSKTAGRFVVVSDIATNNGKSNANINSNIRARSLVLNLKEIVVSLLLIGSLSETVYAKSQIFADRNAPKNNQAQVLKTANGIAQINITTPTKRGVSMNQYRQFDIDTEGAVLNNSRKATETKLGGWISGNQNLNKSEAKVIVNQVNSNNPSQLKGYIEVGGKKAEVIVANPSGISVDGGGFINASKAQIISGSVQFNNDEVAGFNVHKHNKITIQKNGLDVSDTEYTQIISAANEINGKIYGKSIKVSAVTGNVDKDGNSESTQNVSVDVSHLGGMYAGKITMVGNKNGFAVNNAGQLIANSQINIDADGNINNKPTGTIAAKEIKLKAKNFNNQGRTEGSDSIRTDLSGDLNNSGSLSSNGSILINAITGWLNNSGTINSNKLIANTANFNNTGILNIASLLDMVFKGGLNNAGTISNSGATTLRTNGGDITNSGTIKSSQLTTYTDNLNNSGLIAATNLIATYLSGSLNNSGLINSNGTTNINAAHGDINNSGEINGNQINLTTQKLNNAENGTINALTYLNANLSEQLNNKGTINSNGTFQINGATAELNNTGNINSNNLIANIYNLNNYKQLNIKSNLLTNLSGRLYNEGEINSNGIAEIRSTNDIDNIGSIISQELKTNSNNINNHGRISVIAAMESNIAGSLNNRGLISNNGISYINSDNLSNTGSINGNQIDITTNQINNSGSIEADSALLAKVSGSVNNSGLLNSNGITYINADGTISNTGRIYGNHIALGAIKLINGNGKNNNPNSSSGSGGVIAARNRLDIGASEIYNNGVNAEIILSNGSFAIGGRLDENGYAVGLANTLVNDGGLIALNGSGVFGISNLINKNIDDSLKVEEKFIGTNHVLEYSPVGSDEKYVEGIDGHWDRRSGEKNQQYAVFRLNDGTEKWAEVWNIYDYDQYIYQEEVVDNKPGRIYIGGSLTANGSNWLNKDSEILIGGSLTGSLSGITIDETPMNGHIEKYGDYTLSYWKKSYYDWKKRPRRFENTSDYAPDHEALTPEAVEKYIVEQGADTNLPNQTISSATTHNNGLTDIELNAKTQPVVLPASTSALSNININRYNIENPNLPPIETDAQYTEYKKWLSKAYMIERLDPNNLHKRIGDNVSISLSGRLNNLNNRKYTGSIIFANDINLNNLNTLNNSGTIQTRQTMNLDGKQIDNSGRLKGDVVIANADKIDITGGKVIADSAIVMTGKEIDISSTTDTNKDGTTVINKIGKLELTGNNENGVIYVNADNKLSTKATDIQNNSVSGKTLIMGGEIELATIKTSHNENFGEATDKNHRIVKTTEEVGTNITGIGDIQVIATNGKLIGTAVNIDSENGKTSIYGKDGIDIKEGRKTLYLDEAYKTKSHGLLSSKTTNYQIQRDDDLAVSGFIGGANGVLISGGGDISIKGTDLISATNIIPADSTLLADSFISKSAGNNHIDNNDGVIVYSKNGEVDISSAQNYYQTNEYKNTRKSGILGTGNGVMFGSTKEKNTDNHKSVETVGNQMGSTNGQVQVYAGGGVATVSGMDIIAPDGGFIKGKDGAIAQAFVDTYDATSKTEKDSSGLFIGAKGDLINAAQTVKNSVDRASNTNNSKIAALNAAKAAYAMRDLSSQVGNIVQNKNTGNNKLTVTIGTKHQENQATNHTEIAHKTILYTKQGSEFTVATDKNDITLHGFDMQGIENGKSAGRLILNPARDLISKSVDLHDSQNEKGKHYSIEAGIFVGQSDGASGFGVTGEVAYGENSSKLERTTHDENRINAERITFNVGRNADLTGTIAKADRIDGSIKGNLKLASEQDIETYRQKSIDGNISASGNYGGGGVSGNLSYSETKADLKTVNEQTGLFAGKDGIDLTVGGNTHLDGALIASEADKDKNHFSTGTLTFNNIKNEKSYKSTSGSVSGSIGSGGMSFIPTLSHFEDKEHGTTYSAISDGVIKVRDKANSNDLSLLSKDTKNANNGSLTPIDYQKYAENQEVSQLIGEVGASTITTLNDYGIIDKKGKSGAIARGTVAAFQTANNGGNAGAIATNALAPMVSYEIGQHYKGENAEGSLGHIAAHSALGAVTATANGGNALAGAVSAGAAEYLAPKISETLYGKTDPAQLKESEKDTVVGISSFVGGITAGTIGDSTSNTVIGMNTAKTAVENNYLTKKDWDRHAQKVKDCQKNADSKACINQAERELFAISRKNNEELQAACGVYGSMDACQAKQAEAAAGIEYSQSQYPNLGKFDDSFYAAQTQGYKIEALKKLDKIAANVQASNGLQAVDYLGQLNDLAANPEFVKQYRTDEKIKTEFDKQLQQVVYLIQNENRATESVAFDRNLPTENIAKLNAGLVYAEKGLEPVYPELWFWGTGSLLKSGITGLGKLGTGNSAKTISTNAVKSDSFASEKLLNEHFIKHGAEFKAKNASEYLKIGQDTINNGIPVKYSYRGTERTGYVQFLGNNSKGEAKFIFVGTNDAGKITTIHTKSGKDFWRTLNNNPKEKVIYPKD